MIKKHFTERVVSNEQIALNTYLLKLTCTEDFLRFFRPGQFAHIEIPHAKELLLRRPISINYVDVEKKEVHLVYAVVGKGTRLLTLVGKGDCLDVLMPLGNGFQLKDDMKKVWLIGGGLGVAPLKSLVVKYPDRQYSAFLGYRSADCVYEVQDFERFAAAYVATDDGTFGEHGFCTNLLRDRLEREKPDVILSCGPLPFFRSLAQVLEDTSIPAYVSLEQHMGCGTGGCAVCVCKINGLHKKVCIEGPVFEMKEVDALYE